jgi:isopenicillin-N epimerase
MKEHWLLDPSITFLNHGSFGATPIAVLEKQSEWRRRMEREPVKFLARELEGLLDSARDALARFVGAGADDLALVTNATAGVNAVLRAQQFAAGDELLVTTHEYNASRNILDYVAASSGAKVVVVPVPFPIASPDLVIERVVNAVNAKTRLLLIDHITSQTALIFPIEQIIRELRDRGVEVLVDGAHGPGMLPLDLRALGVAYYTGNLHKWVCAPKGAAFLYVREDHRTRIRPVAISHGANSTRTDRSRFHLEFDWTGTLDPTPWLCVPDAIEFMQSVVPGGWTEVMRRNRALVLQARDMLCRTLDLTPPAPDSMIGSMAGVPLPAGDPDSAASIFGGDPLQDILFEQYAIEVPVVPWPRAPQRVLRVSAQLYNTMADYERLAAALTAELQPA